RAGLRCSRREARNWGAARSFPAKPPSRSTIPTAFRSTLRRTRSNRAASPSIPKASMPRWSASARRRAPPGPARATPPPRPVWFSLREKAGASEFLGYETESAEGVVAALVKDGNEVDALRAGESGAVVLNQTPFYAESGGQVGDTGVMRGEGVHFSVTDTQKK